jgi:hypothetical protein
MIFSCIAFLFKATVAVLAVFAMIGVANSVHSKLKERIVFAGISCLFMFGFAWLRVGAAVDYLGKLRRRTERRHLSVWDALDLLVLGGGITVQMFYAWRGSTSTAAGGALEEAFTIFWLWVFYLLCALVVTPNRQTSAPTTHARPVESTEATAATETSPSSDKQIYILELIGNHGSGSVALNALKSKLAPADVLCNVATTPRLSGDVFTLAHAAMTTRAELLINALASPASTVLLPCSTFLLATYAATMWKFVDQQLSEHEWSEFCNLYGDTPAQLFERKLAQRCQESGVRARTFVVVSDLQTARQPEDAVLHAIEIMCACAVLRCGAQINAPVRLLHASQVPTATKRALLGKLKYVQPFAADAYASSPLPLQLTDAITADRFARMCSRCEFPSTCTSVLDALVELERVYNDVYRSPL